VREGEERGEWRGKRREVEDRRGERRRK